MHDETQPTGAVAAESLAMHLTLIHNFADECPGSAAPAGSCYQVA